MNTNPMNVFSNSWCDMDLGKKFDKLGFHMFTIDQHLSSYEDKGDDVIRMTLGKSDRPLSKKVVGAMKDALDKHTEILRVDSEGNTKLRSQISKYYLLKICICEMQLKIIILQKTSYEKNYF